MSNRVVGLDIGAGAVRAVEVQDADRPKPTVTRFAQLPLPVGAVHNGEIRDPQVVAAQLKKLWSTGGFSSKDVVLGMGSQRVTARDLTVPKASMQRIRESLPFQVQELIPVPTSEALLDFYPISEGQSETGPVINGLLVAAVKEPVLNNVNTAQLAGLNPVDVDLIPFALSRVLATSPSSGTQALIDVGANTTCVVVTVGRVPQFVRIIPTGGDDITAAVSSRLSITPENADAIKRRPVVPGQSSATDREALEVIYEQMNDLITAINNTLSYFSNTRGDVVVDRLVLSGGGALLNGFATALSEVSRKPVAWADPFESIAMQKSARSSADAGRFALTVALGLALGSRA